jgi:hypothetical protein
MKTFCVLSFVVVAALSTYSQDRELHWVTEDGNDLYSQCLAWEQVQKNGGKSAADTVVKGQACYSFILGVVNSLPVSKDFHPRKGTDNEQFVDVIILYLRQHPAERDKPAYYSMVTALKTAFQEVPELPKR